MNQCFVITICYYILEGYCDPLSNLNVYSYVDSLNKSRILENGSVIIIAARVSLCTGSQ